MRVTDHAAPPGRRHESHYSTGVIRPLGWEEMDMNEHQMLTDGPLRAAISNAMVRIKQEFYGKGPERAKTYTFDNYVFTVLEAPLTTIEVTLKEGGEGELVREVRLAFEDMMTQTFMGEVEKLTGRRVVGYHSQIVFDPDIVFEFFVLESEAVPAAASSTGDSATMDGPDVESATLDEPGEVGDADALAGASSPVTERPDAGAAVPAPKPAGSTRAAISNALVRLTRQLHGRGPSRAKSFFAEDYLLCALENSLTTVERTLIEGGESLLVRRLRLRSYELTANLYAKEVETLTGRSVAACHSQIVFNPDVLFLVFALEPSAEP
jgi:uncharacterized protein YbcI